MNTYFAAILKATDNGKFPELTDCWRNYHPEAILSDSDYPVLTDSNDMSVCVGECERLGSLLFVQVRSRLLSTPRRPVGASVKVRPDGGRGSKVLYVPVTRKVSPRTWTKPSNSPCKVISVDRKKDHKKSYEYQRSMSYLYSLMHG